MDVRSRMIPGSNWSSVARWFWFKSAKNSTKPLDFGARFSKILSKKRQILGQKTPKQIKFYCIFMPHWSQDSRKKLFFFSKKNQQEVIGVSNREKKIIFLLVTHQMCATPWYFVMFQFLSWKNCENPEKYAKNARFFFKIAR